MRVYVAAPWKHRPAARLAAEAIEMAGHTVISRWLTKHGDSEQHAELQAEAHNDLEDLHQCEAIVVLNICLSEGKSFEMGVAYTTGLKCIVVDPGRNVFHHLKGVVWAKSLAEAIWFLR